MKNKAYTKPMILLYGKLLYGAGTMPYTILQQTMSSLLILFAVDAQDIPGWLTGIALCLGLIVYAVADPYIAHVSNRQKNLLFGKRLGFYIFGVFLASVFNVILWSMPFNMHFGLKFLWLLVSLVIMNIFIAFMQTPYNYLGVELSGDTTERKQIQIIKSIFFVISLALPLALMGIFIKDSSVEGGYLNLSLVNSSIALILGMTAFFAIYPHLPRLRAKAAISQQEEKRGQKFTQIIANYFFALKNRDYRAVVLGYAASLMSITFLTGAGLLFFKYTLDFSMPKIAGAIGTLFLFAMLSQLVWPRLAAKFEKKLVVMSGIILALFGMLIIAVIFIIYHYFISSFNPFIAIIIAIALSGFGTGALYTLPSIMLGDILEEDKKNENKNAPAYTGMLSFFYRAGQSIVVLVSGILISAFQFGPTHGLGVLIRGALGWIVIMCSSIALGVSVYLYSTYKKPLKKQASLQESIADKAADTSDKDETEQASLQEDDTDKTADLPEKKPE